MQPERPARGWRVRTDVLEPALPLERAVAALRARPPHERWVRVVHAIEPVDLFDWLRAQDPTDRLYFGERGNEARTAAAGAAFVATGTRFDVLDDVPRDDASSPDGGLRTFVHCRFDLDATPDATWAAFAPVCARVPRVAIHEQRGRQWLSCLLPPDGNRDLLLARADRLAPADGGPRVNTACDDGERPAWRAGIEHVLDEIGAHRLKKGVFTRRVVHRADGAVDPIRILERLESQPSDAYRFLVQPDAESAFVGLSPERLYSRRADRIASEALAGTTRRGAAEESDTLLGEALLRSTKERHEHDLVRRHIESSLDPLAEELVFDREPHLAQLEHVQHLRTDVQGRLKAGVRDADVLAALHPTPAVCGLPTDAALRVLREHEGFDRGLYCGVVGTWRPDEAEFAVAIRSALVRGSEIALFAGAGIVEGSDPDAEWEETVEKLRTIGDVIARGSDVA